MNIALILDYYQQGYGRPEKVLAFAERLQRQGIPAELWIGESCNFPHGQTTVSPFIYQQTTPEQQKNIHRQRHQGWQHWLQQQYDRYQPQIVHCNERADMWAVSAFATVPIIWSIRTDPRGYVQPEFRQLITGADRLQIWNPDALAWLQQQDPTVTAEWNCSGIVPVAPTPYQWEGSPSIVCHSRIDEHKNQRLLIDMMPYLLDLLPQAHLHLVGEDTLN